MKTIRLDGPGQWHDLPFGTVGNLVIGGPTVFPGHVIDRGPEGFVLDGKGTLVDGWLDTGDLASIDADGFVDLTGRVKDLIIRGGHNIDPATVEDALLSHPDVTGAAAVGKPYKLPRRADATRIEVCNALTGVPGVESFDAAVCDGSPLVTVLVDAGSDDTTVHDVLGRYSIAYSVVESSPSSPEPVGSSHAG